MNATVGCDDFGSDYIKQLAIEGVDSSFVDRSTHLTTGIASISVDQSGQNCIIIVPGANLDFKPETIVSNESLVAQSKVLICQNEISFHVTLAALKYAKAHRTIAILNPAPVSDNTIELLPYCDIVCPNETELSTLTGGMPTNTNEEIQTAASSLLGKGCSIIIVTLGERGACIVSPSNTTFIPAPKVNALDTVGAGDSFIGSLASNIVRGATLVESVTRAIFCASISVTRKGAQKSNPTLAELAIENRPPEFNASLNKEDIRRIIGLI